ncbi:MAG: AAA family ATPase [Patescibacteria group bacterium]
MAEKSGAPSVKTSDAYLEALSGAPNEKSEARLYLDRIGDGVLLEIGPGGGEALARIIAAIDEESEKVRRPKIVVLDIAHEILQKLRATLQRDDKNIALVQADASKGFPFSTGSISAINASSVVHECFTYGGGFPALNHFIEECGRTLSTDGVLIYRDPDGVELQKTSEIELTTPFSRSFFLFFIRKFLDKELTSHAKIDLGYDKEIAIHLGDTTLTLDELFALNPDAVQGQKLTIRAKSGLVKEVERHFMVFCKDCTSGDSYLQQPVPVEIPDESTSDQVVALLREKGIRFTLQGETTFLLSPGDCNLVYPRLMEFADKNQKLIGIPEPMAAACQWGIREGEEHYFYGPAEEIIARFAKFSLIVDQNSILGYSCLCPLSPNHNRLSERPAYVAFLQGHIAKKGETITDQKRHIHFAKMPIEKALPVLLAVYNQTRNPFLFEVLSAFLCIMRNFLSDERTAYTQGQGQVVVTPQDLDGCISLCEQLVVKHGATSGVTPTRSPKTNHVGVVGGIASGKTTISSTLDEHGYRVISLSDFVRAELLDRGFGATSRDEYFEMANEMRRTHGRDILERLAVEQIARESIQKFAIDGMRTPEGVEYLRKVFRDLLIIGVETPREERIRRVVERLRQIDPVGQKAIEKDMTREWADVPEGCQLGKVMETCDFYVNGGLTIAENRAAVLDLIGIPH